MTVRVGRAAEGRLARVGIRRGQGAQPSAARWSRATRRAGPHCCPTSSQRPWPRPQGAAKGRGPPRPPAAGRARQGGPVDRQQRPQQAQQHRMCRRGGAAGRSGAVRRVGRTLAPCDGQRKSGAPGQTGVLGAPVAECGPLRWHSPQPPGWLSPAQGADCTRPAAGAPLQHMEGTAQGMPKLRQGKQWSANAAAPGPLQAAGRPATRRHAGSSQCRSRPQEVATIHSGSPTQGCSSCTRGQHCCAALSAVAKSHSGRSGRSVGSPPARGMGVAASLNTGSLTEQPSCKGAKARAQARRQVRCPPLPYTRSDLSLAKWCRRRWASGAASSSAAHSSGPSWLASSRVLQGCVGASGGPACAQAGPECCNAEAPGVSSPGKGSARTSQLRPQAATPKACP